MSMPTLQDEHRKLQAMVGDWSGKETQHPSPWDPRGGTAQGRIRARLDLDGFFVISDYEEARDGKIGYRGHGVYGWDAGEKCYTMHWFDNMGAGSATPARGTWDGARLVFENRTPMGHSRYVYEFEAEGRYRFRIENSQDGSTWKTFMVATYVRS